MQAYRGALGELREDKETSPFAAWTLEQLKVLPSVSALWSFGAFKRRTYVCCLRKLNRHRVDAVHMTKVQQS